METEALKGYKPGVDFEKEERDPLVEISSTDSTELWLMQWPINQLQLADLDGKEISLRLDHNGDLGSFQSSFGKSYDVVSFAAQEPDAAVFLASGSESKVVGKISRRVCLAHYPDPNALEKSKSGLYSSSYRSGDAGSQKSGMLSSLVTPSKQGGSNPQYGTSHDTLTSTHTMGQSVESTKRSKGKRVRDGPMTPEQTARSTGQSSRGSRPESQLTSASLGSPEQSQKHKSKEKKKKKKVAE